MMNRKLVLKLLLGLLLIVGPCLLWYTLSKGRNDVTAWRYPGNGIPHLSKDMSIKALNEEIVEYGKHFPNVRKDGERIVFRNVNGFSFKSSKNIKGQRFCIKLSLRIEHGKCEIIIGDVRYRITERGLLISQGEREVYKKDAERVSDVILEVFEKANSSTRVYSEHGLLEIQNVSIGTPTSIQIMLSDDCTGYIGPWMWLRGYE